MYKNARALPRAGFRAIAREPGILSDGPTLAQRAALAEYNARIERRRQLSRARTRKAASPAQHDPEA